MTAMEEAVWEWLRLNCAGPEKALPRATIIGRFNLMRGARREAGGARGRGPMPEIYDRLFRQIASDLVVVYKKPICTSAAGGYYVARTMRELEAGVNDLKAKGSAIFARARALEETVPLERQERLF